MAQRTAQQIQTQIEVLRKKFDKTLPIIDGKHNSVYYSLGNKIKQLNEELIKTKQYEFEAQ